MKGGTRVALAKPKIFASLFLTALLLLGISIFTTYASEGEPDPPIYEEIVTIYASIDSMLVNASWLDDEMLRIDVVDINTGTVSSLAVRLSDFVTSTDAQNSRYIMIQATDLEGNLSGVVQIYNPLYVPAPINTPPIGISPPVDSGNNAGDAEPPQQGLTPDGTGTVVDNIVTQNEIEFFTVYTEEGNVFFLVVDRQRNTDNVYLLNAVTEADLMALAEQSGNPIHNNVSVVPTPPPIEPPVYEPQPPITQPEPDFETPPVRGRNNSWIFILLIAGSAGGAAYYFKVIKGKQSSIPDDDWSYDEDEDDYLEDEVTDEGGDDE